MEKLTASEPLNIFLLHGFLGRPRDWDAFTVGFSEFKHVRFFIPDYFNEPTLNPQNDFQTWAENFNSWAEKQVGSVGNNILVGYSLGGRLALHALENKSSFWKNTVCLSTNPGFPDHWETSKSFSAERLQRQQNDFLWSEKFLTLPWELVLKEWNAQAVFGGTKNEPPRTETDFERGVLAKVLKQWSLASQKNMRPLIAAEAKKILWVVGEADSKFVDLAKQLVSEIPTLRNIQIPHSSHRILFDNPAALITLIQELIGGDQWGD